MRRRRSRADRRGVGLAPRLRRDRRAPRPAHARRVGRRTGLRLRFVCRSRGPGLPPSSIRRVKPEDRGPRSGFYGGVASFKATLTLGLRAMAIARGSLSASLSAISLFALARYPKRESASVWRSLWLSAPSRTFFVLFHAFSVSGTHGCACCRASAARGSG